MKILAFCLLSLPLLAFSWRSLFNPQKHGLYRFIVWECILWMLVQNYRYLIVEDFQPQKIISSIFTLASLFIVISAVWVMRERGRVSPQRQDSTLLPFEKTTAVVSSGVYRYIRHPMYSSLFFLLWGLLLRNIEPLLLLLAVVGTAFCYVAARIEEKENLAYFGDAYRQYMQKTAMFVPFLF